MRESFEIEFSHLEFQTPPHPHPEGISRLSQTGQPLNCYFEPVNLELFLFDAFYQCTDYVRKTDINQS